MKYLVSIYLAVVGSIYFFFFLIFAIICTTFFKAETYDPWVKAGFRFLFKLMFVKVEVEGAEKLDKNQTYIFMPNHVSLFDMPVLGGFIPNLMRAVEAERNFKWPIYGTLVRKAGNIPISRTKIHSSIKSFKIALGEMKTGKSITLFPEGHRTMTGEIGEFKKLPFFMAKEGGKPIVPIGLSGLYKMKNKNSWLIQRSNLKVKFGEIITPEIIESKSTLDLRDFVKEKISELVEYK